MDDNGINVMLNTMVDSVDEVAVHCDDGEAYPYDYLVWAREAAPPAIVAGTGLSAESEW